MIVYHGTTPRGARRIGRQLAAGQYVTEIEDVAFEHALRRLVRDHPGSPYELAAAGAKGVILRLDVPRSALVRDPEADGVENKSWILQRPARVERAELVEMADVLRENGLELERWRDRSRAMRVANGGLPFGAPDDGGIF